MGNSDETIRFLRTIFAAGDVFEVRVLNASTADYQRLHAESGYFDYEPIPQAADAIASLRYYGGAYATLNPVSPALLARANNRLAPAKRDCSTADVDVLARRWRGRSGMAYPPLDGRNASCWIRATGRRCSTASTS